MSVVFFLISVICMYNMCQLEGLRFTLTYKSCNISQRPNQLCVQMSKLVIFISLYQEFIFIFCVVWLFFIWLLLMCIKATTQFCSIKYISIHSPHFGQPDGTMCLWMSHILVSASSPHSSWAWMTKDTKSQKKIQKRFILASLFPF